MIPLVTVASLLAAAPPGPEVDAALASLRAHRTVTARLVQEKRSKAFVRPQHATGRLVLVLPDKVRWEYETPFKTVLVVNGDRASMAHPDLGRKQVFDLARNPEMRRILGSILFFLSADPADLRRRFEASATGGGPPVKLTLVPRSDDARALLARIEVDVDTGRGVLLGLRLVEPDGDETRLTFEQVLVDAPVDPSLVEP